MSLSVQIVLEMRFMATPDGKVWTQTTCAYDFWQRYLEVFDEVRVVARVGAIARLTGDCLRADGPGVRFLHVPHYLGLKQFVRKYVHIRRALRSPVDRLQATLYRIPSVLAEMSVWSSGRESAPVGVEVVGDPADVFAPGTLRHPLRPLLRAYFTHHLKRFCRAAEAVAYVNESVLRRRYPPKAGAFVTSYSSVELPAEAFRRQAVSIRPNAEVRITFVGSLAQRYKGADVLIAALGKCIEAGGNPRLRIIGDGRHKDRLRLQAQQLGLADRVIFLGHLPAGEAVRRELDAGDLFVLPARTEGLPRAVIEAMARCKPCIATTVGGIPELLPAEDLVAPDDVDALAAKMVQVLRDPARMQAMADRNYLKAREYRKEVLDARRKALYAHLRLRTEAWLRQGGLG